MSLLKYAGPIPELVSESSSKQNLTCRVILIDALDISQHLAFNVNQMKSDSRVFKIML